jgi:hypothetical protein
MMYLLLWISLLFISSIVLAGQTFDVRTIDRANLNNPLTDSMCTLGDIDLLLVVPGHNYHTGVCRPDPRASVASSEPAATGGPWTRKPKCTQICNESRPLCVFTAGGFAQGRGISLLTDPSTAQSISKLPAFTDPNVLTGVNIQADSPPFVIRELLGRGKGVIANRTIERGDLIMAYTATTIFHERAFDDPDYHMLHTAVDQLPRSSRALWLDLAAHSDGDMYKEKINTNTFWEVIIEELYYVVIPEVSVRGFRSTWHSHSRNSS